ncbi:MAG: hypothetical protein ACOVSW_02220 [Candidatus Kapaibacteriota bacterium]
MCQKLGNPWDGEEAVRRGDRSFACAAYTSRSNAPRGTAKKPSDGETAPSSTPKCPTNRANPWDGEEAVRRGDRSFFYAKTPHEPRHPAAS